ncbi:outer membrane beta-barrel protein [Acinetobacter baumannii]
MEIHKILFSSLLIGVGSYSSQVMANNAQGWLFKDINNNPQGINITGWIQGSIADSNHSEILTPASVFRRTDGFALDQAGLMIQKNLDSNLISRVGPIPKAAPTEADWGFKITGTYGADGLFFRTLGLDEDWKANQKNDFNSNDAYANLTEAYVEFYLPNFQGSNLLLGLFHSPLANEIGFALPSPAPAEFYTHTYGFFHGPAKHVGALWSSHLPMNNASLLGYELGIVRGYNNLEDPNNDWSYIANLRWRSADMSTWIDFENMYGNAADDSITNCGCGSPIPADSTLSNDKSLNRYQSYLTLSKTLDDKNRLAIEASYGSQEKSVFADSFNQSSAFGVPEHQGVDAQWHGVTVNYFHKLTPQLTSSLRAEYFDTDGVHAFVPYSGIYKAVTTNLSWLPTPSIRIRPEVRYDWYSGHGKPFGIQANTNSPPLIDGSEKQQFTYSLDLTLFF